MSAPQQAKFVQGNLFKHVAVMSLTSSVGLMAIFVVDLLGLGELDFWVLFVPMIGSMSDCENAPTRAVNAAPATKATARSSVPSPRLSGSPRPATAWWPSCCMRPATR